MDARVAGKGPKEKRSAGRDDARAGSMKITSGGVSRAAGVLRGGEDWCSKIVISTSQ